MLSCPLLSVPTKKPSEVDYGKPLKKFVKDTFGADQEKEIASAVDEFNALRTRLCSKYGERSEAIVDVYNRYFDQLNALEAKAVICVGGPISVHFKWQRAFERDSARKNISLQSSAFEKVCVLFNIGALQSQLAETQNRASEDGLKQCMRFLQSAAGTFQFLRDQITSPFVSSQLSTSELHADLNGDLLAALAALMLAQAQECVIVKGRNDRMKDVLLVKLTSQCREMYAEFLKLAGPFRDTLPREWFSLADAKRTVFGALSEYYGSRMHVEAQEHGKAIARLTTAQTTLAALAKSEGKQFAFNEELNAVRSLLETSQKDNNMIYHDKIADYRALPPLDRAQVAKATPVKQPLSSNFRDLFEKLVPIRVHAAMKAFESKLNEAASAELRRVREATALINSVLSSFNLPAALEEVLNSAAEQGLSAQRASEVDLPDSVKENARKVRDAGGIAAIRQLFGTIPEILTENRAMLDEIALAIDEEENADRKLREQFGTKWSRTPSDKLNASFRAELTKYRTLIETAASADATVRDRYSNLEAVIELLSRPDEAIREAMPKRSEAALTGNQVTTLAASSSVSRLKALCDRVRALKSAREELENDLSTLASSKETPSSDANQSSTSVNDVFCNMRSSFIGALQADGATIAREEELSDERVTEALRGYRELIQSSLNEQNELLGELQDANNSFVEERARVTGQQPSRSSAQETVSKRAEFLQSLHSGYDGYVELKHNVEEGNKFYADLLQILLKFQQRVQDFCFGRKIEKDEALSDLNASAASGSRAQPPETPAYQKNAPPPARPPPPVPTAPTPGPAASAPPPPQAAASCPPPSSGVPVLPQPPAAAAPLHNPMQPQQPPPQLPYPAPVPAWPQPAPQPQYTMAYPGAPMYSYPAYPSYPQAPAYPYPQPLPGYQYAPPAYGYPPQPQPQPQPGYPGYPPPGQPR